MRKLPTVRVRQILQELRAILEMAVTEADVALAGVGQDMAGRIEGLASCFLEFVCFLCGGCSLTDLFIPQHSVVKVAIDGLSRSGKCWIVLVADFERRDVASNLTR